jgi:hypothetical protein
MPNDQAMPFHLPKILLLTICRCLGFLASLAPASSLPRKGSCGVEVAQIMGFVMKHFEAWAQLSVNLNCFLPAYLLSGSKF